MFSVSLSYWESGSVSESEELDLAALSRPNVEEVSVYLRKVEGKIPLAPWLSGEVTRSES